jgi:hypothetical protein
MKYIDALGLPAQSIRLHYAIETPLFRNRLSSDEANAMSPEPDANLISPTESSYS